MEKVRSVYPNAMHVERKIILSNHQQRKFEGERIARHQMDDLSLFRAFYREIKQTEVSEETEEIFKEILREIELENREELKKASNEVAATK